MSTTKGVRVPSVGIWTGREAAALRCSLRLSVRAFAEHLGVAVRTVTKWESLGRATQPRPDTQAILDTALARAAPEVHDRFLTLTRMPVANQEPSNSPTGTTVDYDSWADDLDRAMVRLGRQEFHLAKVIIDRCIQGFTPNSSDTSGMDLLGRSLRLHGKILQDQGALRGPISAEQSYRRALAIYVQLHRPRRIAQVELQLTVVDEMSGQLTHAAKRYAELASDPRLTPRDRARAMLWVGTALSKAGHNTSATAHIEPAISMFDRLDEHADWSVAHQKLALAHRGGGRLTQALQSMDTALANQPGDTPLHQVRLRTAHAHLLVSDPVTRDTGIMILDDTATTAKHYGMLHQLASIQSLRRSIEH